MTSVTWLESEASATLVTRLQSSLGITNSLLGVSGDEKLDMGLGTPCW